MSEHLEALLEQTTALRAPIPGDSPGGADVSLEADFEAVKSELDKLTSIEGGEPDWSLVVQQSEELLTSQTKDLRLAVWLTVGGLHRSAWTGYARGLLACRGLITEMWDDSFPKRDKARANIIGWLAERAAPLVEELTVDMSDGDDVRVCAELVEEIDSAMADKLGDGFSGIRHLVTVSKRRVNDIPEPPPPPPEPTEWADDDDDDTGLTSHTDDDDDDAPAPASVEEHAGGQVALSGRAEDADATTRTCADALVMLARSMTALDPTRAWAYRLHRQGIWMPFEHLLVEGGVIAGPSVDADVIESLRALVGAARWPELVVASEEASARFPLWLDPHRFVALALERLGTAFNAAREAVGRDTTDFVRRHAFLLETKFADGLPVASPDTVEWLEAEAKRWQLGSRANDVGRDEDLETAQRFAEAKTLVAAGRHAEGLAIATQLARRGSDTRDRFRWSLDVARLAIQAGAYEVARPILEGLVSIAQAHALETWDPTLCTRLYAGLYRCLPADAEERANVFEVLCRLDPGAALRARNGNGAGVTRRAPVGGSASAAAAVFAEQAPDQPAAAWGAPAQEAADDEGESEWTDDD